MAYAVEFTARSSLEALNGALDDDAGRAAFDRVLMQRVFPAISATDVSDTETERCAAS
jgi:hypothetical protein